MKALTKEGQQLIEGIAQRYELKSQSVEAMVKAVVQGNGSMAQFNIPELGGNGQWMRGGMTMVGDMFNNSMKAKVDKLCTELSELVSSKVIFEEPTESVKSAGISSNTWPSVFGSPTSSGSQNNFRYAYFGPVRRLVIEENGKRSIYDTKHHNISGISQQQGSGNSYLFTSQDGPVDISSLTLISEPSEQTQELPEVPYDVTHSHLQSKSGEDDVFAAIEKVNKLYERGLITETEFNDKKKELLARL
jgi:hypothetical protein